MDIPKKIITEGIKETNNDQATVETDSKIYEFLDKNLEKKSAESFSLGFSKHIIRKIEEKQQRRFNIKMYCLVSLLLIINFPIFISFFLNTEFVLMVSPVFLQHKFIFAFLIIAVILIQYGDKLIRFKKDAR